jgi:hypothetical protein
MGEMRVPVPAIELNPMMPLLNPEQQVGGA